MTPLLNPLPVLGLRSPCSFFNQDIYFLRDIWQCLGMFLVVATGECTNIQWVKDSDSAKWPTVHMTAPTKMSMNADVANPCQVPLACPGSAAPNEHHPYFRSPLIPSQGEWPILTSLLHRLPNTWYSLSLCVLSSPSMRRQSIRGLSSLLLIYL